MVPKMNLIVAVCEPSMGIGREGSLPWRLPKEMASFRRLTTTTTDSGKQNAVVMGRKCWDSIPNKFKPLNNRVNIVLSRTLSTPPSEGVYLCHSMDEVFQILSEPPLVDKIETVWNIGGRDIYELGLKSCHRIYMTEIKNTISCDTFFPQVDWTSFKKVEEQQEIVEGDMCYRMCVYEKQ